jgi:hypothetical protein
MIRVLGPTSELPRIFAFRFACKPPGMGANWNTTNRLLKNSPRSFRDAAKRRTRNPEKQEIPRFWIPGSRLRRAPE